MYFVFPWEKSTYKNDKKSSEEPLGYKIKKPENNQFSSFTSTPGRIRTHNLLIRWSIIYRLLIQN